ncbi:MAG TPA: trypsin-like peptidase domain-containing protein [Planctomicrobium sp.]|nr:trypsin-like peptidase domain-containing protein [Planctomicrobium sp.]
MRTFTRIIIGLCLFGGFGLTPFPCRANSVSDVIPGVQSRVVKLFGAGGLKNLASYGSGFLVSADGHIVTVWSHLLDSDTVTVVLDDGRRFFGKVIGTDSQKDLAVLKIDAADLPHFELAHAANIGPGAPVLAFSNVFKVAVGDEPVSVMHGIVSAKTELSARKGRYQLPYRGQVYVIDAVTNNPGASGGVLTTYDGRLVGILGREVRSDQNHVWLNYAVPVTDLRQTIDDIVAGRHRRHDPLAEMEGKPTGGGFQPIDFGLVLVPDVVFRTPAYIETVVDGSQAARLGLQADDLIIFANGELIHSLRHLDGVLRQLPPGDDLQLVVRRDNELISVTFRIPRQKP